MSSDFLKRYNTIRDAILTCAQKLTWVSIIYHTEPENKVENKKEKTDMLRSITKQSGESMETACILHRKGQQMLWHCWSGIRKSIWSIQIEWWGVGVFIGLEWGADGPAKATAIPKPNNFSPHQNPNWHRLTQLPLNRRFVREQQESANRWMHENMYPQIKKQMHNKTCFIIQTL